MSVENSSAWQLMALGRPFQLGMLYNIRTDQLIPGLSLSYPQILKENIHSDNNIRQTRYQVSTEDTFEEKTAMLGINRDLKLSVLAGLVKVSGSAEYINDRKKTEHTERMTLQYSTTTRFDYLTMVHLGKGNANHPQIFDQQIATHVVAGIIYGAEAFFLFERRLFNTEDRSKVYSSLKAVLEKIPKLSVSVGGQSDLTDEEKNITEKLTCQFYSDFNLETKPSTFEEAIKLYKELPNLLGQNNLKVVPKQIWLYPLHLLDRSTEKLIYQISDNLVNKSMEIIENLHQFEIKANDLKISLSSNTILQRTKKQLSTFCTRISEFENDIKKKLMDILPKIRSGITEEDELAKLLEQVDGSPFNRQKLENWLERKTEEIQILTNFTSILTQNKNIDLSPLSLAIARSTVNCNFVFLLVIHVIDKNDSFLNEMYQYLEGGAYNQKHETTPIDRWFDQDDVFEASRQNVALFIKFSEANKHNKHCQFVANEQYCDEFEKKKGVSIIFYRNGVRTNFKISSEPEEICATVMKDQSVKVEWSKPQFGSESVQKYEIYGQKSSNKQWDLLSTTTDATESTIISDLDGKYQFKIKGITLFGVTPESDISNTTQVAPPTPKKLEICGGNACPHCGKCRDWHYNGDLSRDLDLYIRRELNDLFNENRWSRRNDGTCHSYLHHYFLRRRLPLLHYFHRFLRHLRGRRVHHLYYGGYAYDFRNCRCE